MNRSRILLIATLAAVAAFLASATVLAAQSSGIAGERYAPGIWIDPDGCEHWVMDDGFEGFMSPHVTRDGVPVCRRVNTCAIIKNEHLFPTDSARINKAGRKWLSNFFKQEGVSSFIIVGHTDNRGSDEYNIGLSGRRASNVATIARKYGAIISGVRAYGERKPRASNATPVGQQKNRRVEILCVR
ncbi:MAG: OmpA family protein [Alphaproteobacteria bacterium]|nr:OmpA family protein [Alphaproteobacteria bacterium]NNF24144.1 OmpA family protein [Paracoccaceae bacterium]